MSANYLSVDAVVHTVCDSAKSGLNSFIWAPPWYLCGQTPKTAAVDLPVCRQEPHEVQCAMAPTSITIDMLGVLERLNKKMPRNVQAHDYVQVILYECQPTSWLSKCKTISSRQVKVPHNVAHVGDRHTHNIKAKICGEQHVDRQHGYRSVKDQMWTHWLIRYSLQFSERRARQNLHPDSHWPCQHELEHVAKWPHPLLFGTAFSHVICRSSHFSAIVVIRQRFRDIQCKNGIGIYYWVGHRLLIFISAGPGMDGKETTYYSPERDK